MRGHQRRKCEFIGRDWIVLGYVGFNVFVFSVVDWLTNCWGYGRIREATVVNGLPWPPRRPNQAAALAPAR